MLLAPKNAPRHFLNFTKGYLLLSPLGGSKNAPQQNFKGAFLGDKVHVLVPKNWKNTP